MAGAPRNSTAVALAEGAVLALDQATFQHVLRNNPAVGTRVLQQLIRRLRDAEDQIEILMVRDTQLKIVVALVKLAHQALGSSDDSHGSVALSVSPMDLSSRVGLDVETVKRSVTRLREAEYVRIVDEKVEIPDVEALCQLVELLNVKDQIGGGIDPDPRGGGAQATTHRT